MFLFPILHLPGAFTKESMKNSKTLEGYNQFQSDWVSAVKDFVTDPGVTTLSAAGMHLQALYESKLNTWVAVQ